MITRPVLPAALVETGIVAIVRAPTERFIVAAVETLVLAGVRCVELTLTMTNALDSIESLASRCGEEASIGAGTVLTREQARRCVDAGATFLVSPSTVQEVVTYAVETGTACLPGALTPSEIVASWEAGASAVKLFPASLGGVQYLRDVRAPLPDIPLIPTGGVLLDEVPEYLRAGALAVGMGSPLFRDALAGGDLGELAARAALALRSVRDGRAT